MKLYGSGVSGSIRILSRTDGELAVLISAFVDAMRRVGDLSLAFERAFRA